MVVMTRNSVYLDGDIFANIFVGNIVVVMAKV